MRILATIFIPFLILLSSNAQKITSIDLENAKFQELNINKICTDIRIVPLETHKDALLNIRNATYYLTDKYIIAISFLQGAYLFNRETGAFLREISSIGQGPDQYTGYVFNRCGFDEINKVLFASIGANQAKEWKCINIETNKMLSNLKKPLPKNGDAPFTAYAPWFISNDTYISFCNNKNGKDKTKLVVYTKGGNIIKKYPNHLEYKKIMSSAPANNGIFYYYNNNTYFKEWHYNDTVFRIDRNSITPHLIFKSGNKQPSYYHQDNPDYNKKKYLINFVYESNLFVLFNFTYITSKNNKSSSINECTHTGYYDKKSKQTYIISRTDFLKSGYSVTGLPLNINPISINRNKEIIAQINPEELLKCKDKISPKYKYLLNDLYEEDNPIVIIAKLKDN